MLEYRKNREDKYMLDVCLLGTGGMMPLPYRWLSALMLRYNGSNILMDCGEGTQVTMKMLGWSMKAIDVICLTHYHGDHVGGLPGLLLTIGNADRKESITIIGPKGLERVVNGLRVIAPELPYKLNLIEIQDVFQSFQFGNYKIETFKLDHSVLCYGYNVVIDRKGKFLVEKAQALGLPTHYWGRLQNGETITYQEKNITPDMILGPERKGLKVTYCTDTRPVKRIVEYAKGADLFVCEGTYGEDEDKEKAYQKKHMTFSESATLAKEAQVKTLWLTHFSPSLVKPKECLHNATHIFKNTVVGKERMKKVLKFDD